MTDLFGLDLAGICRDAMVAAGALPRGVLVKQRKKPLPRRPTETRPDSMPAQDSDQRALWDAWVAYDEARDALRSNLTSGELHRIEYIEYPEIQYAVSSKLQRFEDTLTSNFNSALLLLGKDLKERVGKVYNEKRPISPPDNRMPVRDEPASEGLRPSGSDYFVDARGDIWHIIELQEVDPAEATYRCLVERGDTDLGLPDTE